ncbi:MAG TPA: contractile injection system protein, VgrG/Pvc8 family [Kofleriaceae bacterium]
MIDTAMIFRRLVLVTSAFLVGLALVVAAAIAAAFADVAFDFKRRETETILSNQAASPNVEIRIGGSKIPDSDFLSHAVDRDMFQPDTSQIVLSNQGDIYSSTKLGDSVEIKVGDQATSIYQGEVTGLEPIYAGGERTRIIIRAMNRFHRLLRGTKSVTFQDKTDPQILQQVITEAGLHLVWRHESSITYKHVYQHNQSGMEFLRTRAARAGCHVWCVGTTLYCVQPDLQSAPIATLDVDESQSAGSLRSFKPRLDSSQALTKMTVKGWDPDAKALITGEAWAQPSPMGEANASSSSGWFGANEAFISDLPVCSKEEADMIAKAALQDRLLRYVTGEATCTGDPHFDLGAIVQINANGAKRSDTFNGRYYIMGITHRHIASSVSDGGYATTLRLARDAQGRG